MYLCLEGVEDQNSDLSGHHVKAWENNASSPAAATHVPLCVYVYMHTEHGLSFTADADIKSLSFPSENCWLETAMGWEKAFALHVNAL